MKNFQLKIGRGNPTGFWLTSGQTHDLQGADVSLKDTPTSAVVTVKAWDAQDSAGERLFKSDQSIEMSSCRTRKIARKHGSPFKHVVFLITDLLPSAMWDRQ